MICINLKFKLSFFPVDPWKSRKYSFQLPLSFFWGVGHKRFINRGCSSKTRSEHTHTHTHAMGFLSLLQAASMPMIEVLIISLLGAFMATDYLKLLSADARKSLNKIVFTVFTPSLIFASLAKSVRFEDVISWWFMPVNIGLTFIVGGTLGWIASKILRPEPHLQNLIIAMCASGNLGNILLIIVPAICKEDGNPFGDKNICSTKGLSYASFSMAVGAFYIWTYTYQLIRSASSRYKKMLADEEEEVSKEANKDLESNEKSSLLDEVGEVHISSFYDNPSRKKRAEGKHNASEVWSHMVDILHQLGQEIMSPPVIGAILGFIFGGVGFLHNLIIGDDAPLRIIDSSVKLLGDATIPCITLILGGNLTQGLRNSRLKIAPIMAVILVRYVMLPAIGLGIVQAASRFGFLPSDPLFRFVLMIQFALPPAMNIGTMTQLFEVAEEECSVLFLWTYLVAAFSLTGWSTVYMWILS